MYSVGKLQTFYISRLLQST